MRLTVDGWLEPDPGDPEVTRFHSSRISKLSLGKPLGLVWHYTGDGGSDAEALNLAQRIQNYQVNKDRPASWHLLITRSGRIFQSVPTSLGSWHVGLPGVIAGLPVTNVNKYTIGIELQNAGRLKRMGEVFYRWPWERKKSLVIPADRAVKTSSGWFESFTEEQERAARVVVETLVKRYGWSREVCSYQHADFTDKKEDGGPVLINQVLPRILDQVFKQVFKTGDKK